MIRQTKALIICALAIVGAFSAAGCVVPTETVPGTALYEIDVFNNSSFDVWVYVDGVLETYATPGETHAYDVVLAGDHHLVLEEAYTGAIILDQWYTVTASNSPISVEVDDDQLDPVVAITNTTPGCVVSDVDGVWVTSYLNDTPGADGTAEVCEGETGYFSLDQGFHTVRVYDQSNTTRVIDGLYNTFFDFATLTTFTE